VENLFAGRFFDPGAPAVAPGRFSGAEVVKRALHLLDSKGECDET